MSIGVGYSKSGWALGVQGAAYRANYNSTDGLSVQVTDFGKILSGERLEYKNTNGELVTPDYSLAGTGRAPHFKEVVVRNMPVSYFEYPSGYLTGHNCQIQCITPKELEGWTSKLHKAGVFGKAVHARASCETELAARVDALFHK